MRGWGIFLTSVDSLHCAPSVNKKGTCTVCNIGSHSTANNTGMLNNIHKYFTDTVQIIMTEKESKQTIDANVRAIQVQKKRLFLDEADKRTLTSC